MPMHAFERALASNVKSSGLARPEFSRVLTERPN